MQVRGDGAEGKIAPDDPIIIMKVIGYSRELKRSPRSQAARRCPGLACLRSRCRPHHRRERAPSGRAPVPQGSWSALFRRLRVSSLPIIQLCALPLRRVICMSALGPWAEIERGERRRVSGA